MSSYWFAHLEQLLIALCDWLASHNVACALLEGLPADGCLSLSLLRRPRLIFWKKETVSVSVAQLHHLGHSRAVQPRAGHVNESMARPGVQLVRQSGLVAVFGVLYAQADLTWSRLHCRTHHVHHDVRLGHIQGTKMVRAQRYRQRKHQRFL